MKNLLQNNICSIQMECFEKNLEPVKALMESLGYQLVHEIGFDRYFAN